MAKKLKITQVRSVIGTQRKKHRKQMEALGFKRNYRTLYKNDTPQIRGMLKNLGGMVVVEEIDAAAPEPSKRGKGFTIVDRGPGSEDDGEAAEAPDAGVESERRG